MLADLSSLAAAYELVRRRCCGDKCSRRREVDGLANNNSTIRVWLQCGLRQITLTTCFYKITPLVIVHVRTAGQRIHNVPGTLCFNKVSHFAHFGHDFWCVGTCLFGVKRTEPIISNQHCVIACKRSFFLPEGLDEKL